MSSRSPPGVTSSQRAEDGVESDESGGTPVGVDVGSKPLAVAATPDDFDGIVVGEGEYVQQLYLEASAAGRRVSAAPEYDDTTAGDVVARYWPRLRTAFEAAAETVLDYAQQHPAPTLVLEDFPGTPTALWSCINGDPELASWCPLTVQAVLVEVADDRGVPVTYVPMHNTSRECHRCGEVGDLASASLRCTNNDCPIERVCRDRSAAAVIAKRGRDYVRCDGA